MPFRSIHILFLLTLLASCSGCSSQKWQGMRFMNRAEKAAMKAHLLMKSPEKREERVGYYRVACDNFLKAYDTSPSIFTLNRIETAHTACLWVNDFKSARMFEDFGAEYSKKHPKEAEYGDMGVPLIE